MTDPSYIRDFKAFTKGPLRFVDLKRLDGELYGENDRALGVLRASLLEAALETYLMSYVRPSFNADLTRRLFEFSGILGPFGAKITIAYAFNWIGPETRHDLELIRQIRNEFAHCRKALAFTDASGRCLSPPKIPRLARRPITLWIAYARGQTRAERQLAPSDTICPSVFYAFITLSAECPPTRIARSPVAFFAMAR